MTSNDPQIRLRGTVRRRETSGGGVILTVEIDDGQEFEVAMTHAVAGDHRLEEGDKVGLCVRYWGLILGAPRMVKAGRRQLHGRIGLRLTNGDTLRLVLHLDCGADAVADLPAAAGGDADTSIGATAAVLVRPEDVTLQLPAAPEQEHPDQ